ncbi:hypothetical protein F5Y01DRAFT_272133 [Xylaria sp. FL0043]|nr:hypothetical protein F5Y01DRAFT_272133 [Xylaria sp. FL0043]
MPESAGSRWLLTLSSAVKVVRSLPHRFYFRFGISLQAYGTRSPSSCALEMTYYFADFFFSSFPSLLLYFGLYHFLTACPVNCLPHNALY